MSDVLASALGSALGALVVLALFSGVERFKERRERTRYKRVCGVERERREADLLRIKGRNSSGYTMEDGTMSGDKR